MTGRLLGDRGTDASLIVDEARTPADRARILREVEGRRWAVSHGIPTAETVAFEPSGGWLISRRLVDRPGTCLPYLEAALAVALRIQRAPLPRRPPTVDPWKAPRSAAVGNAVRLLAAGVSPREYVATRSAAQRLPATATVHNDFHRSNVLDQGERGVAVIDWEFLSAGPPHRDFLQLLVNVRYDHLAQAGWEMLLRATGTGDHATIARQFPWLALRTYASQLGAPEVDRDPELLAHNRRRWRQAREWASWIA